MVKPYPPPFTWEDKPFSFSNQTNLSSVSCRLSEDHHHFHSLSQFGQPWWHLSVGLLKRSCVQQSIFKSIWRVPKREGFHSPQQNRRQNPQTQELNWKEYGKPHNNHGQNITFIWKKNIAPFPKKPSVSLSFSFSVRSSSWEAEPIIGYKSEITSGMRMFNKVKMGPWLCHGWQGLLKTFQIMRKSRINYLEEPEGINDHIYIYIYVWKSNNI